MKQQNISHWEKNEYFEKFLLFVQTFAEATFTYSFESYRLPALNCHYLCYDVVKTAKDIERKILMDGNFLPMSEEFEQLLSEDPFINNCITNNSMLIFAKDKNLNYYDISKLELKTKIREYKEIANFIKNICEVQHVYFDFICDYLLNHIFSNDCTYENKKEIYSLTRMLVTELVNGGYSQEFLFQSVQEYFYNKNKKIECTSDILLDFLNHFTNDKFEFKLKFMVNYKMCDIFEDLNNFEIGTLNENELKLLNSQRKESKSVTIKINAVDYYSAYIYSLNIIQTVLSLHNLNQHNSKLYVSSSALVFKINENNEEESPILVNKSVNLMKKLGNTTYLYALYNDVILVNNSKLPYSFIKAVSLHNVAIECKDMSNQLLNLWTIIEVLITSKRDNEDRINTISNVLCSILNRNYLYSNIEQLLQDIRLCTDNDIDNIVDTIEIDEEIDSVEKFALILSLEKYKDKLTLIRQRLNEYPLLDYRIEHFSGNVFKNSKSIYDYLNRHAKRIRWHIMRIYRNRNMIVHNGSYMPYRNLLIENLHFYVDTLFNTLIEYYFLDLTNNDSIYMNIRCEETLYHEKLGFPVRNKKEKFKTVELTENNALELIFNGYNGNWIKKEIDSQKNKLSK